MGINLSEALDTPVDLNVSMDMSVGFSAVDIDQFRFNAAGARVTSTTTSDRFFWAGNVNAEQQLGDFYVSGRAGVLYAVDETDQFLDSAGNVVGTIRSELGRISAGGRIAYFWNNFEPYFDATYRLDYEFSKSLAAGHPNDNDDIQIGLGLRYYREPWSFGVEYNRAFGREDFDEDAFGITIRGDF